MIIADRPLTPLGFAGVLGVVGVVKLPSTPVSAAYAYIQADGGDLRWRDDGTDPTSSVGMLIMDGEDLWYTGDLHTIRFIAVTTANLHVSYYKP